MPHRERIADIQPFAELAQGPATTVYKGYQAGLDRFVLLKVVHAHLRHDAALASRFEQEARLAAQVRHPNVVALHTYGQEDGRPYLVAEFVDGTDLRTVLAEHGPLPIELALYILHESAQGLAAAHRHGVLHRDLKPANLLLAHDGAVKLADFGMASLLPGTDASAEGPDAGPGEVRGTLRHLAPEILQGAPPSVASDLFALGATFFEMLTGRPAFAGTEAPAVIDAVLHDDPLPALDRLAAPTPEVRSVCAALLAKDPVHRPGDAPALLSTLQDLRAAWPADAATLSRYLEAPAAYTSPIPPAELAASVQPSLRAEDPPAAPPRRPASGPPRRALVGLLAVALALVVGALVWYGPPRSTAQEATPSPSPPSATSADAAGVSSTAAPPSADTVDTPLLPPAVADAAEAPPALPADTQEPLAQTEDPTADSVASTAPPPADPPEVPNEPVALTVQVSPWAEVYLDGAAQGRTPLPRALEVAPGAYILTLRHPDFPDYQTELDIAPGSARTVSISLWDEIGTLAVEASPWADVYVDGEQRDTTPIRRPLVLAPGRRQIALVNPGLGRWDTTLVVARGARHTLRVNLHQRLAQ